MKTILIACFILIRSTLHAQFLDNDDNMAMHLPFAVVLDLNHQAAAIKKAGLKEGKIMHQNPEPGLQDNWYSMLFDAEGRVKTYIEWYISQPGMYRTSQLYYNAAGQLDSINNTFGKNPERNASYLFSYVANRLAQVKSIRRHEYGVDTAFYDYKYNTAGKWTNLFEYRYELNEKNRRVKEKGTDFGIVTDNNGRPVKRFSTGSRDTLTTTWEYAADNRLSKMTDRGLNFSLTYTLSYGENDVLKGWTRLELGGGEEKVNTFLIVYQ